MNEVSEHSIGMDMFIKDIQCILKDINATQAKKRTEINNHFKNIASNPEHSYTAKEQVAILFEIMNCYNANIVEYQKNMRELGIITKNLIKSHNNRSFSNEIHNSDETIVTGSSPSLYDYFIQFIWGRSSNKQAVEIGREPSVDLANLFVDTDNDIIEHTFAETTSEIADSAKTTTTDNVLAKKNGKRRNTIQPIIKHIPHL
uniref:Uncharacterized protein n=1 Tax=viral metagenome TaxID=1070528 RepID=A0A6C0K286_9ZZZZ